MVKSISFGGEGECKLLPFGCEYYQSVQSGSEQNRKSKISHVGIKMSA